MVAVKMNQMNQRIRRIFRTVCNERNLDIDKIVACTTITEERMPGLVMGSYEMKAHEWASFCQWQKINANTPVCELKTCTVLNSLSDPQADYEREYSDKPRSLEVV